MSRLVPRRGANAPTPVRPEIPSVSMPVAAKTLSPVEQAFTDALHQHMQAFNSLDHRAVHAVLVDGVSARLDDPAALAKRAGVLLAAALYYEQNGSPRWY